MSENPIFNIRDYVQLKSGGPVMRIISRGRGRGAMEGFNTYGCRPNGEMGDEKDKIYQEPELVLVQKKT